MLLDEVVTNWLDVERVCTSLDTVILVLCVSQLMGEVPVSSLLLAEECTDRFEVEPVCALDIVTFVLCVSYLMGEVLVSSLLLEEVSTNSLEV